MIPDLDAPWHSFKLPNVGKLVTQSWQSLVLAVHADRTAESAFDDVLAAFASGGFRAITAPMPEIGVQSCLVQLADERISIAIEPNPAGPQVVLGRSYPPDVDDVWGELGVPLTGWDVLGGSDQVLTASVADPCPVALASVMVELERRGWSFTTPPVVDAVGGAGTATRGDVAVLVGVVRTGPLTLVTLSRSDA
jgi:hypothetical protein